MSKNDDKIKALLTDINAKKEALGVKPRANWKTNGIIKSLDSDTNINTINTTDKCVLLAARFLLEKSCYVEACKFLDLPDKDSEHVSYTNDVLSDIKLRSQMIAWDIKKKQLEFMEKKLKDLRSEDAKTEDALADIENSLKV